MMFGVLVRVAMALALVVVGGGHILHTETSEEKILNAVAMAFVLDLDDFAYDFCVSDAMKLVIEELHPFEICLDDEKTLRQSLVELMGGYFRPATGIMFTCYLVQSHCAEESTIATLSFLVTLLIISGSCFFCGMWTDNGLDVVAEWRSADTRGLDVRSSQMGIDTRGLGDRSAQAGDVLGRISDVRANTE
jgi:hypothetical protein